MFERDIARSFVLDFNRVNDLFNLLNTDVPKRYVSSFPPADVFQLENDWVIRMAVAGFTRNEIEVSVEDEQLIVKSAKAVNDLKLPEGAKILQSGIGKRAFERRWKLSQGMEVVDVVLQDGILTIGVTQQVPEDKKPRLFKIEDAPSKSSMLERVTGLLN